MSDYEGQARASARESLVRTADRDVNFFAGFITSWVARNLTLRQLAELVEQMERALPEPSQPGSAWERHDDPEQQS